MPSVSRSTNICAHGKNLAYPTSSADCGPALSLPLTGQLVSAMSVMTGIARSFGTARSLPPFIVAPLPHAPATSPAPVTTQNCRRVSSLIGASQDALERPRDERDVQIDPRQPARHTRDVGMAVVEEAERRPRRLEPGAGDRHHQRV